MERILVAVDGSRHSDRVVDFASDLAKTLSAEIVLIYVMRHPDVPEDYVDYVKREALKNPVASYSNTIAEQIIAKLGERIRKKGITFEGIYHLGNPAEKIIETAESKKVRLIVLGVVGLHSVGRLKALGSVSRRVIENSPVPVLVVPLQGKKY
jgi:nucleotide-binding universal stress UspA family protein